MEAGDEGACPHFAAERLVSAAETAPEVSSFWIEPAPCSSPIRVQSHYLALGSGGPC